MIKQLCYELFIIDWEVRHITKERKLASMRSYHRDVQMENVGGISYDEYILDNGYDGELYPYFDEILETEYLNESYMCELLKDEDLLVMYYRDLGKYE